MFDIVVVVVVVERLLIYITAATVYDCVIVCEVIVFEHFKFTFYNVTIDVLYGLYVVL